LVVHAGLSAAGLALTRPDGVIFFAAFPAVLAICVMCDYVTWKDHGKKLMVFIISAMLPVVACTIFRIFYFGDIFPNTYYAKDGPTIRDIFRLVCLAKEYLDKTYDLFYGIFSWRAGLGILILLVGSFYLLLGRKKTSIVFLFPAFLCSLAVYCLLPQDWMGEYRFASPFFMLFSVVLFALFVHSIRSNFLFPPLLRKAAFLTIATAFLSHSIIIYAPRTYRFANNPTVPFEDLCRVGVKFNYYAEELEISNASLLSADLGGVLYYSKHRVYDLAGLCDRKIARLIHGASVDLRTYVLSEICPTFIFIHNPFLKNTGFSSDIRFSELYEVIETRVSGGTVCSGDYVLKTALKSGKDIERLRRKISEKRLYVPDREKRQPFPRC
jgi:hypothetical protein